MRSMFWMLPEYLAPEMCDQIIADALKLPAVDGVVGQYDYRRVDTDARRATVRWIKFGNEDFQPHFWPFVERQFLEANRSQFQVDADYIKSIQFTTYHSERLGHFGWHNDVFWFGPDISQRKLTMVIQLTDPANYEGGNLILDLNDVPPPDQLRKQGTILVFPSFVHHKVEPVVKGERNCIVAWQEGPLWR